MKRIKPLTNRDVRRTLDRVERARVGVHDLPMFQRDDGPPAGKPPARDAPVPRLKHR